MISSIISMSAFMMGIRCTEKRTTRVHLKSFLFQIMVFFLLIKRISLVRICFMAIQKRWEYVFTSYTEPIFRWTFRITSKSFIKWNKISWLMYRNCATRVYVKWCFLFGFYSCKINQNYFSICANVLSVFVLQCVPITFIM